MITGTDDQLAASTETALAQAIPSKHLPSVQVKDLPEPPERTWRIVGPGIVGAGVGLASGEFILWPYISSQVGLVFLWAAALGIATQWFINMEIERYTLATGETALTGFSRLWKHWGIVFAILIYFANLWPGWATSSATMVTYLFGGDARLIAIVMLLVIGVTLTLAPVVYTALERVQIVKVAAVGVLIVGAICFAIPGDAWRDLPDAVTSFPEIPSELGVAFVLGALAFAGSGGGQNLCQSNWIRDKGFGMGAYVPRIVSPLTGEEEAAPSTGYIFEPTDENLSRWRRWWRFANLEQALTFALISFLAILFMSLLAYSTVFGRESLPDDVGFLEVEGEQLKTLVEPWFGTFFWVIGAFALFAAAMGIIDYTTRVAADVLKTNYLRHAQLSESRLYFLLVWGLVAIGIAILGLGLDQPLLLLVISACVGGVMMFIYSVLLLILNSRVLPKPIRVRTYRVVALIWATGFFGVFSVLTIVDQVGTLFE
jgi:hypothetical protein